MGLMHHDHKLDDQYVEEPLEEPKSAKIDNSIPKAGQINTPGKYSTLYNTDKIERDLKDMGGKKIATKIGQAFLAKAL